jgi:hypothetical protein
MKKIFQYFAIIILFSLFGIILQEKASVREAVIGVRETVSEITGIGLPCAKPFRYAIGSVDARFSLDKSSFLATVKEAEQVWETQTGKNLFEYDANSDFKINLIFDERQIASNEADRLEEDLKKLEVSQEKISNQYEDINESYENKMEKYNADMATYEKKLKNYNEDVKDWNKNGGTEKEYEELKDEKEELEKLFEKMEQKRLEINSLAGKNNALVSKEREVVSKYNANVLTYKNKYGGGREFEKGLYDGKEINLYQFKQIADLRLTIIHELGHALGIGHTQDPQSIMYYLMGDQAMENPQLSQEDIRALKTVCKFK